MIRRRPALTPEQERLELARDYRKDLRRFRAARTDWIDRAVLAGASLEVAAQVGPVLELDRMIAETAAALAALLAT